MFTREYLQKSMEESWGRVDPTELNWDILEEERKNCPTVLWALEESYHKKPISEEKTD